MDYQQYRSNAFQSLALRGATARFNSSEDKEAWAFSEFARHHPQDATDHLQAHGQEIVDYPNTHINHQKYVLFHVIWGVTPRHVSAAKI